MKAAALALLMVGASAGDAQQFRAGDDLVAFVRKNCGDGCVVFTAKEAKDLNDGVSALMRKNAWAAFDAGRKSERESCRNAI
jgi:hypothetical protein